MTQARGGRGAVVPDAEVRTYHDQPVLASPVWTWEIPWYLLAGGLSGASSLLAVASRLRGEDGMARTGRRVALAAAMVSPALLVSDLGRPARFFNMLRVFRPTSPMNMGSWLLSGYGTLIGVAAVLAETRRLPRVATGAEWAAAGLAPLMTTYTAVLLADTAVPVWHDARRELPFAFAATSLATAGAAATALSPPGTGLSRGAAVAGAAAQQVATVVMEWRLGPEVGRPYHQGRPAALGRVARALTTAGAVLVGVGRGRRRAAAAGSLLVFAGGACERWSVFLAGRVSAADPAATLAPQRRGLREAFGSRDRG